jgi:hypothetical protein
METPAVLPPALEAVGKRTRCGMARNPLSSLTEGDSTVRLEESPPGTELRIGAALELSGAVRTSGPLGIELRELLEVVGPALERGEPTEPESRLGADGIERLGLGEE